MVANDENTGDKTLSVTPTKTLTLKPRGVEQGVVRQSFSHGRTKAVRRSDRENAARPSAAPG